ncbi:MULTISPECIES: VOC family protein [unclassified Nocardioides]|jgi:catechol 2,3-dioxygenase-like lactoylglutathione lyase family enzyme|uniref:VOC family protein n=1 Tax=unclassified Nocardioides TaxID=2615069 RepID=UPI000702B8F2|nr:MULTISPECIES: VOC family protein [unclassified Nocardioides]KRC54921.1 glyoxalase [Nocardioides sp. Root79]KRC73735.1 glyoxalase [Nocardioides sp. Root240]
MGNPRLRSVVLDTTDVPRLAEFYRELLGWSYPPGVDVDELTDWRAIIGPSGERIAFQEVAELPPTTWPTAEVPQQAHLDLQVDGRADLDHNHERALALGAVLRLDRSDDPEEPLRVYADPAGHTFCLFTH